MLPSILILTSHPNGFKDLGAVRAIEFCDREETMYMILYKGSGIGVKAGAQPNQVQVPQSGRIVWLQGLTWHSADRFNGICLLCDPGPSHRMSPMAQIPSWKIDMPCEVREVDVCRRKATSS